MIGGSVAVNRAGKELRETVDRAKAAASALLGQADSIAEGRLARIDAILENTVGGLIDKTEEAALVVIAEARRKIEELERIIFADLNKVIWEAECSGSRLVIGDLGKALGDLGEMPGTHQIRLTPPTRVLKAAAWYTGCFWWCKDPYLVDVMEPFGTIYIRVRDLMEESISAEHVKDDTPANHLVGTYEYLSAFALKAACFYPGSEERYNREYVQYREKARQWRNVVQVKLQ